VSWRTLAVESGGSVERLADVAGGEKAQLEELLAGEQMSYPGG
jgi:hypothetical protein